MEENIRSFLDQEKVVLWSYDIDQKKFASKTIVMSFMKFINQQMDDPWEAPSRWILMELFT